MMIATVTFALGTTILTIVISFITALALDKKGKGYLPRGLMRSLWFLPALLSGTVVGMLWRIMYNYNNGIMNELMKIMGQEPVNWLETVGVTNWAVIVAQVWVMMGMCIIIFLAGLQSISPSLYEAADVEGCSAWESFWKITFPMVSPLLLVNCIYTIIDFFMKNDNRVMELIYQVTYQDFKFGISAAMSWIYFAIALAFIGISSFIISKAVKSYE